VDLHEQVRTVVVTGSLDPTEEPGFARRLAELAGDGNADLIIDVSGSGPISPAGVRAVLTFAQLAARTRRRVRIVTGDNLITRVVWASHAGTLLDLHESLRSAYGAVADGCPD
jgi:hypothetical protein